MQAGSLTKKNPFVIAKLPIIIVTAIAFAVGTSILGFSLTSARAAHVAGNGRLVRWGSQSSGSQSSGSQSSGSQFSGARPWGSADIPTGNQKGYSVAVSGKTAVVATPGLANDAGAAYIYEQAAKSSSWHLAATLHDPRKVAHDEYAWAVAISSTKAGTYVAIGGNDTNGRRDLVYIYQGSGRSWHLQATIADIGKTSQDMFGDAIAISGQVLVVGASCVNQNIGDTYVLVRFGSVWRLQAHFPDPTPGQRESFGQSVSISGYTVLVGSNNAAYVYSRGAGNHWAKTATIANPSAANDLFGLSVALSGKMAIVGAPEDIQGEGATYVFTLSGKKWVRRQKLTTFPGVFGGEFGWSVALTGSELAIGMPIFGTVTCGTALVFRESGGKWVPQVQMKNPKCTQGDKFGFSVAATGTAGVFGAPYTNKNQGAAYLLPLSKGTKPAAAARSARHQSARYQSARYQSARY